jgi:hypothetical protein
MPHTPGDWEVKEVRGQVFVAAPPYEGHPYFGVSRTIEIMSDEDYPTKEADAWLLAASPKLLTACQEALDFIQRLLDGTPDEATDLLDNHGEDCEAILQAAIAKTEVQKTV